MTSSIPCAQITPSGIQVGEGVAISKWVISQGTTAEVKAIYPKGQSRVLIDETVCCVVHLGTLMLLIVFRKGELPTIG